MYNIIPKIPNNIPIASGYVYYSISTSVYTTICVSNNIFL